MVYRNHREMGARWCVKTTSEKWSGAQSRQTHEEAPVLENYRWEVVCQHSFTTYLQQREHQASRRVGAMPVAIHSQIIIGCLMLAVLEHYTVDITYGLLGMDAGIWMGWPW